VESTPRGPARTLVQTTPAGDAAARWWLVQPVGHVRDGRLELMVKLALLDRAGVDPADLLVAQRVVVEPIVEALRADRDRALGFDRTLAEWRYDTAVAMLAFLDAALVSEHRHPQRLNRGRLPCRATIREADPQHHRVLLAFDQFFLLTNGGSGNSTTSVVMLVYRTGFFGFNLGGAAALSVMLLVALNALQLRVLRKDHTK
jgi:hypothetical protein